MAFAIVYCDNENMPYHKYDDVLAKLLKKGIRILCYKIFGGVKEISKLDETYRLKHNYILCPKPLTRNKNSADISIAIEIMKDLYKNAAVDTFIICSNDTDFIPLCREIQMHGKNCWLATDKKDSNELLAQIYDKILDLNDEEEDTQREKIRAEAERLLEEERRLEAELALDNAKKRSVLPKQKSKNKRRKHSPPTIAERLEVVIKNYIALNTHFHKDKKKINLSRLSTDVKEAAIDWSTYKSFKVFIETNLPEGFELDAPWVYEINNTD
jgi:hypothetical protein